MLIHPQFDPIAISIGPLAIRWYGLMYLLAFLQFALLARRRMAQRQAAGLPAWSIEQLDDLLFYGVIGVVLGGRLGQVLFYEPTYYLANPLEILMVWHGGMSFHGGFLGVLVAMGLWAKKHQAGWWETTDFIAPLVPLGLMFGRIGNFINGELWGRVANPDLPWAMVFPQAADGLPRHPSQLYHAGLEGLLLFLVLWVYSARPRPVGAVSGLFLVGYGLARATVEFFREPDHGIFGQSYVVSMGQWLSLPMILIGLFIIFRATHNATNNQVTKHQEKV